MDLEALGSEEAVVYVDLAHPPAPEPSLVEPLLARLCDRLNRYLSSGPEYNTQRNLILLHAADRIVSALAELPAAVAAVATSRVRSPAPA